MVPVLPTQRNGIDTPSSDSLSLSSHGRG
uniref:Uncharacterized protein n=1 Tax=Nelumbo nucifera TaxID=4432 RepID=A0A822ZV91_NELNU|nr:TPA_asm: hypothetical protein HUJ06_017146 [Nelumbo nucifera]